MSVNMTNKLSVVTRAIQTLLDSDSGLSFQKVYYGRQGSIPKVPSASVAGISLSSELVAPSNRTENTFSVEIMIYHSQVQSGKEENQLAVDILAEETMDVLNADKTLGGLVYTSVVTNVEPGYLRLGNTWFRSSLLSWEGRSKVIV